MQSTIKQRHFQSQGKVHKYAYEGNCKKRTSAFGRVIKVESLNVQTSSEFGMYKSIVDLENQSVSLVIDGDESERRQSV